jgi:hypothetical protein
MNNIPTILNIKVLNDFKLEVLFSNSEKRIYDCNSLLSDKNFIKLKNFNYFKNVKVDSGGYGISWDSETDLSEYELWKNGVIV